MSRAVKTITEFLRRIDDQVVVPVNIGAYLTMRSETPSRRVRLDSAVLTPEPPISRSSTIRTNPVRGSSEDSKASW